MPATRAAGAKAAVYMHPACFDDAAPCFEKLRDAVLMDAKGQPTAYGWTGPDTVGKNWRTSLGSPQWREHLLQQGFAPELGLQALQRAHQLRPTDRRTVFGLTAAYRLAGQPD